MDDPVKPVVQQLKRAVQARQIPQRWPPRTVRFGSDLVDGEPSGYYSQGGVWVAQPVARRYPDETDWLGYPEFRDQGAHIRGEIVGAVREDEIAPDDARDLMRRLGDIEVREALAFRDHGWRLDDYDRSRIRGDLDQLDRDVDRVRREP